MGHHQIWKKEKESSVFELYPESKGMEDGNSARRSQAFVLGC